MFHEIGYQTNLTWVMFFILHQTTGTYEISLCLCLGTAIRKEIADIEEGRFDQQMNPLKVSLAFLSSQPQMATS